MMFICKTRNIEGTVKTKRMCVANRNLSLLNLQIDTLRYI